jgi:hypothetical protein
VAAKETTEMARDRRSQEKRNFIFVKTAVTGFPDCAGGGIRTPCKMEISPAQPLSFLWSQEKSDNYSLVMGIGVEGKAELISAEFCRNLKDLG